MSDGTPSGPHTAMCHSNHRGMTRTQRDEIKMKKKGPKMTQIKVWRQEYLCVSNFLILPRAIFLNLSQLAPHSRCTNMLTVFPFLSPSFVFLCVCMPLFYHFFTADLPFFNHALRLFVHAERRQNRHFRSFFPCLSHSAVLKNRKKQTSESLCPAIVWLLLKV